MKNKKIYSNLSDYLSLNQFERAKKVLEDYPNEIDVTYSDGIFFLFVIEENNLSMLNTLINYYERNQLQGDSNSLEYKVAKHKLQQILQDAVNTFTPSKEIQEVLEKYLPKEEDVNSEQDLSDLENLLGFDTKETQHSIEEDTTNINVDLSGDNIHKVY
jgi:hypothetical protein